MKDITKWITIVITLIVLAGSVVAAHFTGLASARAYTDQKKDDSLSYTDRRFLELSDVLKRMEEKQDRMIELIMENRR